MPLRVAVIGGGPLGLIALKTLLQDGFDVTLFESRSWIGGLWKPDTDGSTSALQATRFNSSRYRSSLTDFPMPEDMDDFPRAPQLLKYFSDYADCFGLRPYIHLDTKVTELIRSEDGWTLKIIKDGNVESNVQFDKIAFATGTFVQPKLPNIEQDEVFRGTITHSVKFHDPAEYKDQIVLIIGLHASAQDTVAALSGHASKVYASHRSGLTLVSEYANNESVYDSLPPLQFDIFGMYASA